MEQTRPVNLTVLDLIFVVLAATSLVDVWLRGSIFAGIRERIDAYNADPEARAWWMIGLTTPWRLLWELLRCPFCLSYHATFWVGVAWWSENTILRLIVFGLAAQRLLWGLNAFLPTGLMLNRLTSFADLSEQPIAGTDQQDELGPLYTGRLVDPADAPCDGKPYSGKPQ